MVNEFSVDIITKYSTKLTYVRPYSYSYDYGQKQNNKVKKIKGKSYKSFREYFIYTFLKISF